MWNAGDGYPDLSGGMVYWISDGMNVYPGSDWIYGADWTPRERRRGRVRRRVLARREPRHDDLVRGPGQRHLHVGHAHGHGAQAPKLIAIPFNGDSWASWLFAELGADRYDYSGDEADICSNSYGWSGNAIWAGYDELTDMYASYISAFVRRQHALDLGDRQRRAGYGTLTSVWDPSSVHVGAGTTMQYRYWLGIRVRLRLHQVGRCHTLLELRTVEDGQAELRDNRLRSVLAGADARSTTGDYFGSIRGRLRALPDGERHEPRHPDGRRRGGPWP